MNPDMPVEVMAADRPKVNEVLELKTLLDDVLNRFDHSYSSIQEFFPRLCSLAQSRGLAVTLQWEEQRGAMEVVAKFKIWDNGEQVHLRTYIVTER